MSQGEEVGLVEDDLEVLSNNLEQDDPLESKQPLKPLIKHVALLFRKNDISYSQSKYILSEVRRMNELKDDVEGRRKRKLPRIPSEEEKEDLLELAKKNFTHWLIIKLLFSTGLRVSEMINIKCKDVSLKERKIFIEISKTGNRCVLFPTELEMHLSKIVRESRGDQYLLLSRLHKKYTRQGVWAFINKYIKKVGIEKKISVHSMRHYFATRISYQMTDSEVMLLIGNSSKDSTQIYQHLAVEGLRDKYERAVR